MHIQKEGQMKDSGFKKEQSEVLVPILNDLTEMILTLRNAFNRQNQSYLKETKNIQSRLEQDLDLANKEAEKVSSDEKMVVRIQSIISHLEMIQEAINELVEPLGKQIREGILFSNKGLLQTNFLFDHEAGIFRSLADIFLTENPVLKDYVMDKIEDMSRRCIDFATDHEARLIEGLCQPQAAPVFLAILDSIRTISHHEHEIVKILGKE
jgi:Na+/phosphate symporter